MNLLHRNVWIRISVIALPMMAGCRVDECASIPKGAIPPPAGRHVQLWQQAQTASAAADQGVFYQNEFLSKSAKLTSSGEEHVAKLIHRSLADSIPIVVEASQDPTLDEARRQQLGTTFADVGVNLQQEQISIGKPAARGLDGFRAQQAVRSSMGNGGGGGMGGGGMGGGGMGGGGMGGGGMGGGGMGGGGGGMF